MLNIKVNDHLYKYNDFLCAFFGCYVNDVAGVHEKGSVSMR